MPGRRGAARSGRLSPIVRLDGPRARQGPRRRHDLSHLLHDETHHRRGAAAAVRAGRVPVERPGASLHPSVERPQSAGEVGGRRVAVGRTRAPDVGAGSPHAHVRPRLRGARAAPRHDRRGGAGVGAALLWTGGDARDPGRPTVRSSALGPSWEPGATREPLADRLADRALRFHPGTRWFYSTSTDMCGRLVEIMSGQPFDEYLQRNVFDPLGMVDTGFTVPDSKIDRLAANYARTPDKKLVLIDDPDRSAFRRMPTFLSGGGGLVSTTSDYLRFAQMLANGGELDGARILGRKTVDLMTTNHLPDNGELRSFAVPGAYGEVGFDGTGFGLTVAVGLGPARTQVIGSAGDFMWGGWASTIFWVDPNEDLVVVFMTQFAPSGTFNFRNQLKALVYPTIVD